MYALVAHLALDTSNKAVEDLGFGILGLSTGSGESEAIIYAVGSKDELQTIIDSWSGGVSPPGPGGFRSFHYYKTKEGFTLSDPFMIQIGGVQGD